MQRFLSLSLLSNGHPAGHLPDVQTTGNQPFQQAHRAMDSSSRHQRGVAEFVF